MTPSSPSIPTPSSTPTATISVPAPPEPSESTERLGAADLREEYFFLILAVFIGILSGLGVVLFRLFIDWTRITLLSPYPHPPAWRLLLAPSLVGLLVSVLVIHFFPTIRGSGVNQTKAALYIFNGYIPIRSAIGKFLCSALSIGSGQSLGPEDPSLQIGATIASALGRLLELSREKLRLLAPVGASAGLAAAFNAPISAVLFVIEEVIGRWSAGILGSVVLAAVSSVVVVRWFLGADALFRVPVTTLVRPGELIAYAVLGVIGALAAVLFARLIEYFRPRLRALPRRTQYILPALGGLLIGLIGWLGAPQVMGAGYSYMDQAMHDQFTWKMLAVLAILKILATTVSYVVGAPGGMFAPTLFIGAMLGGSIGLLEQHFFPHLTGTTGTYCLVGMGVLFAAFLRVPMTSVFMVLEVSGNYAIILPVIVANTVAYVISRLLQPTPIFDLLTRQDGLILPSLEEQREEDVLHVEDAMQPVPSLVLNAADHLEDIHPRVSAATDQQFLVRMSPSGWSLLHRADMDRMIQEGKQALTLGSVLPTQRLPYLYPDLPLDMAVRYIGQFPMVPVVNRADLRKLEGIVTQSSVFSSYRTDSRIPD
jgi:chloride channel protein, CIC family